MIRSAFLISAVLMSGCLSAAAQSNGSSQEQKACSRDASRFCRQQMADGDSAVQQCLMQNRSKLGQSCSKVFESHGM